MTKTHMIALLVACVACVSALMLVATSAAGTVATFKCPANPQGLDAASYFAKHPLPPGTTTATALKALACFPSHTYSIAG